MRLRKCINLIILCIFITHNIYAQNSDSTYNKGPRKYIALETELSKLKLFQGFTISADLFGPIQYLMSDYGNIEGAVKLNLKNTYFPIVELGLSSCESIDSNTDIKYSTTAPYVRIGFDINLLKNKFQENRLYAGLRYGLSTYKYDYAGPVVSDPIWSGDYELNLNGINATSHWGELVVGVEVKVWHNLHMGWSLRLKKDFSTNGNSNSKPYYIPGYGKTSSGTSWGGTYNLIFDINRGMKNKKAKQP